MLKYRNMRKHENTNYNTKTHENTNYTKMTT